MANTTTKSGARDHCCLPQVPLPAYKPTLPMSKNEETNDSWQTAHDCWEEIAIRETLSYRASNSLPRKRFCRICHQAEENGDGREKRYPTDLEMAASLGIHTEKGPRSKTPKLKKNPLIHPCMCVGSIAYVHVDCLNKWRTDSPRRNTHYRCGNCKYKYNLSRPWWAAIFGNEIFLKTLVIFLLLLLIVGASYLAKVVDVYGFRHMPSPDNQNWYHLHGETVLWLDRVYLLAGLTIVSALGLVYLVIICLTRSSNEIDDVVYCGGGSGIACLGAESGDAGAIVLLFCILIFGWLMILAIIYMAIKKVMERMLLNVWERILEVPYK